MLIKLFILPKLKSKLKLNAHYNHFIRKYYILISQRLLNWWYNCHFKKIQNCPKLWECGYPHFKKGIHKPSKLDFLELFTTKHENASESKWIKLPWTKCCHIYGVGLCLVIRGPLAGVNIMRYPYGKVKLNGCRWKQ